MQFKIVLNVLFLKTLQLYKSIIHTCGQIKTDLVSL